MVVESGREAWTDAAHWRHFLGRRFPGLAITIDSGPEPFLAHFCSWSLADIEFTEIRTVSGQRLSVAHASEQAPDSWYLPLQLRGGFHVGQDSHELRARAGHLVILDSAVPHWRFLEPDSWLLNVRIPKSLLAGRLTCLRSRFADPIHMDCGQGRIVRDFIMSIWRERNAIVNRQHSGLMTALVGLTGELAFGNYLEARASGAQRRSEARRLRLIDFIRTHYTDPRLDVAFAAAACGMSVRYVHRLMYATGTSFLRYVCELRLQRARRALVRDPRRSLTITAIALQCGFINPAHFSSAFHRRYGMTPSAWHRQHVQVGMHAGSAGELRSA